jgi:hypothetical protein
VPSVSPADQAYRRELEDGLLLRWSTPDDTERLCVLYGHVFRDGPDDPMNEHVPIWTRDMMSGSHPLIQPTDFAVVENRVTGALVTATCLLRQSWEYGGIAFQVGRPEVVATDPQYRNRGLVRAVFELIHARSAERGDLALAITGIRYYYRQFGYEYALDLIDRRSLPFAEIPLRKDSEPEPYRLRRATLRDVTKIAELYERERSRASVSARIDESYWRWMISGVTPASTERWHVSMIESTKGTIVGYVTIPNFRRGGALTVRTLHVKPKAELVRVLPSVLRAVRDEAHVVHTAPDAPPASSIDLVLGRAHPVYDALGDRLPPAHRLSYAWYVRVPDLPAFVRHVTPVLERRLAASVMAGYSGSVCLNFYRGGLRLVFSVGRLTAVEDWTIPTWGKAQAGFPPFVFLQLLFGYRSLDDLRRIFPDVWAHDVAVPLLHALFPPQHTWVLPLD